MQVSYMIFVTSKNTLPKERMYLFPDCLFPGVIVN